MINDASEQEPSDDESQEDSGQGVPEDFQKQVMELVSDLNIQEAEYLFTQAQDKLKMLKKSQTMPEKKGVFDTDGMPE